MSARSDESDFEAAAAAPGVLLGAKVNFQLEDLGPALMQTDMGQLLEASVAKLTGLNSTVEMLSRFTASLMNGTARTDFLRQLDESQKTGREQDRVMQMHHMRAATLSGGMRPPSASFPGTEPSADASRPGTQQGQHGSHSVPVSRRDASTVEMIASLNNIDSSKSKFEFIFLELLDLKREVQSLRVNGTSSEPEGTADPEGADKDDPESDTEEVNERWVPGETDFDGRELPTFTPEQTIEQRHALLLKEIVHLSARVDNNINEDRERERVQKVTDKAQDQLLQMQMDQINRDIRKRTTFKDLLEMQDRFDHRLTDLKVQIQSQASRDLRRHQEQLDRELNRVLEQLQDIADASEAVGHKAEADHKKTKAAIVQTERAFRDMGKTLKELSKASKGFDSRMDKLSRTVDVQASSVQQQLSDIDGTLKDSSVLDELRVEIEHIKTHSQAKLEDEVEKLTTKLGEAEEAQHADKEILEQQIRNAASEERGATIAEIEEIKLALAAFGDDSDAERKERERAQAEKLEELRVQLDELSALQTAFNDKKGVDASLLACRVDKVVVEMSELHEMLGIAKDEDVNEGEDGDGLGALPGSSTQRKEKRKGFLGMLPGIAGGDGELPWTADLDKLRQEMGTANADDVAALQRQSAELRLGLDKNMAQLAVLESRAATLDHLRALEERDDEMAAELAEYEQKIKVTTRDVMLRMLTDDEQQQLHNGSLEEVLHAVAQTRDHVNGQLSNLQLSSISHNKILRQCEKSIRALTTRDMAWEKVDTALHDHAIALAEHCNEVESSVARQHDYKMSVSEQMYMAGNTQLIAEMISQKADYETVREMISMGRGLEDQEWDDRVDSTRDEALTAFLESVMAKAAKAHPDAGNPLVADARNEFLAQMKMALLVALSKYKPIQVGATLFGKRNLGPSCVACNRPFNVKGENRSSASNHQPPGAPTPGALAHGYALPATAIGTSRAARADRADRIMDPFDPYAVPEQAHHATRSEDPATRFAADGSHPATAPSDARPHVYRSGFKFPKVSNGANMLAQSLSDDAYLAERSRGNSRDDVSVGDQSLGGFHDASSVMSQRSAPSVRERQRPKTVTMTASARVYSHQGGGGAGGKGMMIHVPNI